MLRDRRRRLIQDQVADGCWDHKELTAYYMPSHQALFNDPLKGPDHPDFDQVAPVVVQAEVAAPAFMLDREFGHEPEQFDMAVRYLYPSGPVSGPAVPRGRRRRVADHNAETCRLIPRSSRSPWEAPAWPKPRRWPHATNRPRCPRPRGEKHHRPAATWRARVRGQDPPGCCTCYPRQGRSRRRSARR